MHPIILAFVIGFWAVVVTILVRSPLQEPPDEFES